jgi:NAD(P)H-dependent FMN reductase
METLAASEVPVREKTIEDSRHPAVLLASSRPNGNTAELVDLAFPCGYPAIFDIGALNIGYYTYDDAHAGDDFLPLVRKLLSHAHWVIATPLYWYTMSAQAKTFLDRLSDLITSHKELGRQLRGKSLAVLCTGNDPALPPSFDEPFQLTCQYLGMRYLGSHYGRFDDRQYVSDVEQLRRFAAERIGSEA